MPVLRRFAALDAQFRPIPSVFARGRVPTLSIFPENR